MTKQKPASGPLPTAATCQSNGATKNCSAPLYHTADGAASLWDAFLDALADKLAARMQAPAKDLWSAADLAERAYLHPPEDGRRRVWRAGAKCRERLTGRKRMPMTKSELKSLWALPADIAARQKRIDKLRRLLDELPREVSDTVQSTAGTGNSTIICHATVHGRPSSEPLAHELRALLAQQQAAQAQHSEALPAVIRFIEGVTDAELRVILSTKWVDGGTWADCAKTLGHGTTAEQCRKQAERFFKKR